MRKTIAKSIGIGIMLILSIAIVILGYYATIVPCTSHDAPYLDEDYIFTKYELDTVDVIYEDGIRWYTIDTIWYEVVEQVVDY